MVYTSMSSLAGSKVRGGKALYGARIGILMLEAQFPRIPGDMGHAETWPFPVHYKIVRSASPQRVVLQGAQGLLDTFIAAAQELVADGVDGISTNCGFLALYQRELQAAVPVPVLTSSLMQVPMVQATLPAGKRVGVLTISKASMTPAHLQAAGLALDTPLWGAEGGQEFTRAILGNEDSLDVAASEADLIQAALDFQAAQGDLGAIVLECTNMIPYARAVQRATGLPVYSIYSALCWFQSALRPPVWSEMHP